MVLISSFLEIDFEINISDKKSRRFDDVFVLFLKCFFIQELKPKLNKQCDSIRAKLFV